METKRCAYCHKLQRVGSLVCSRCGRSFAQYGSRGGRSWGGSVSHFSLPAASPHHVGHYSGLHPEDQPYQSQIMITPQRFIEEMQEKQALQREPQHIVLPSVRSAPASNRRRGISQAPTGKPFPRRDRRRRFGSGNTSPGGQETRGSFGRGVQRGERSRPFVGEALRTRAGASPAPTDFSDAPTRAGTSPNLTDFSALPTKAGASPAPTDFSDAPARAGASPAPTRFFDPVEERIFATDGEEDFELLELPETEKIQGLELALEDPPFSITNDGLPSLEDLPVYMREALRMKPWPSRMMSTVLVSIGFCVLLATSISLLVLMGHHPTSPQTGNRTLSTTGTQTNVPLPPHLQISTNQAIFTATAPGVVSSQTITLKNSGSGQAVWEEHSDQPWLTTFPKSGTFADSENTQVTVNRGGMVAGSYTGHVTFSLQGQENTPVVLNVTMGVAPLPAQLSISTTSLSYATVQSQAPDSQVMTIRNTGGQSLRWDATVDTQDIPSWLSLSLYHGVIPSGIGQPITVSVASQNLAIGTYTGLISFTGDADAQVQVALTVLAPGKLVIAQSTLALTTQQTNQTLALQNSGGLPLDWTVQPSTTDPGNWLSVTPASGTLAPGQSITITVLADATSLVSGTYQGMLTFFVGGQTQQVTVSFVVTGTTPTPVSTTPTPTPISTSTPTSTAVTKEVSIMPSALG